MAGLRQGVRTLVTQAGTPGGIAGGVALGLSLSLVPIPFAGMFLALALAPLLRLNLPATYVGTAIVNPLSGVFFYSAELWIGMWLLDRPAPTFATLRALDAGGWFATLRDMLGPFVLGAAVLCAASVTIVYPLVYAAVHRWRRGTRRRNDDGADPRTQADADSGRTEAPPRVRTD